MKKFDTFQTFARGAKSLVAILLVMLMAVGSLFAQTTYTFSNYTAGTQYAVDEEHVLDGVLTIYTTECHFRTDQLRIYSSASHNGFFYSNALPNNIDSISFNIGYKVDNLLVYGSSDGLTWTLVGSIAATEEYADKGIGFGNNEFNYFKCDVEGTQQLRITSFTMFYKTTPEPPTPIEVSVPTFAPEAGTYTAAQNVTIACATEGAAIYYTLDGSAPTANSTLYENAIEITETTTINAIAILDETISDMATATYTIEVTPVEPDEPTVLELDSIATLPYAYNFEDVDPYFMINNGEATNKWYIGQAQTFDNKKLYISSNNGTTNKYDITAASTVTAYRDVMIPATGAVLSFDYRVNGQTSTTDYLKVDLNGTEIARLVGENDWTSFRYDISGEMAGEVRVQFTWVNNASAGNQFPAAIDNISVIETPCSQPTALAAAVDSTTAVITWEAVEGQTAWNFQYKLADYSEWYTVPATATTVTLNDLQGNSNYVMRVQAVCGENVSAWTNGAFTVACQTLESEVADITIGTGTSSNNQFPISGYYNHSYNQQLFTEEELSAQGIVPGTVINSLSFNYTYATSTVRPVTMWLATTSTVTSLSSAFVSINEFTQVFSNTCQEFNNSNEGWNTITLDQPFTYTGGSLVLATLMNKEATDDATTCFTTYSSTSRFRYTSNTGKARYYQVDGTTSITFTEEGFPKTTGSALSGTSSSYRNNIKFNVVISICSDEVACVAPTGLQVSDITPNSAVLTWTAGAEGQTNFIVEYQAEGATEWTSVDVNDTTYTLTELAQLTNYSVKVKANCGDNNWSEVVTASFRTKGICAPVTNLETANVSNTTTLTWEPGDEETAWLVQFKPATAGEDAWTSIDVSLIPMTTFGGLQGNVDYDVRVKALCDPENAENQSEWATTSFHSGCAAFELPFAEEFPTNTMPICWENQNFLFASSGYAYTNTNGAELITPAINIPAENPTYLAFEVRGSGNYTVLASYRGTRADRFAEIYTGTAPNQNTVVTIALDDLYKGRAVNFKIVNNSTSYQYFYFVKVNQCPFELTSLESTGYTGTTVALAWTADEAATNYQIQYGEQGFTLGEGTIVDVIGASEDTISQLNYETTYDFYVRVVCEGDNGPWYGPVSATTAPACSDPNGLSFDPVTAQLSWSNGEWGTPAQYNVRYKEENAEEYTTVVVNVPFEDWNPFVTISGLASNTTYEMGVQSVCGENMESNWVSITVTTPCMPLTEIPYTQDFEGDVFPPECWSQEYVSGTQDWETTTNSTYGSGSTDAMMYYDDDYNTTKLITPAFDLSSASNLILSFKHSQAEWAGDQDELSVYYRTSMSSNWVLLQTYTNSITTMTLEEIAIPAAAMSSSCQFAFEATVNYGHGVYLDDVTIKPAPTCGTPTISVNGLTATITPNLNYGTPVSYELILNGDAENTVTIPATTTSFALNEVFTTLALNTSYTLGVRAVCGTNDNSEWSDVVPFTTPACWESCTYIVEMEDSFGDGWNGNAIYVMVDGIQQESLTVPSSSSSETATVVVCNGAVSFKWHVGSYASETSFIIKNESGATIYTCTDGSTLSEGDVVYSAYCGTMPSCGTPSISLVGTELTITPNAYATSTPIGYELMIGTETHSITTTTANLNDLFTLVVDEEYELFVRAICGETDASEWTSTTFIAPIACQGTIDEYSITGTSASTSYLPSYSLYNYSLTQQLYPASEVGVPQGGIIYSLSFNITGAKSRTIDLYVGTTSESTISTWIPFANFQKVYTGTAFAETGTNEFTFTTPIVWNGTDNLVVMVDDNTGSWSSGLAASSHSATNQARYVYSDGTNYDPATQTAGTNLSYRNDIVFNICANPEPPCPAPKNITLGTVTETTAQVSWTAGNSETEWEVSYTVGDQTVTETTTNNPYTITGLSASSVYAIPFSVKALCSATEESTVNTTTLNFNTVCGLVTVPYSENFDAYTSTTTQSTMVMPICWNRKYTGTSTSYGAGIYNSSSYAVSGTNSLRFYNYCSTSTSTSYGDIYVALPQMDAAINELMISFDAKPSTTTSYNSFFEIGVITDVEATDYNSVFQPIGNAHIVPAGGQSFNILLSDYTGANGHIAFRVTKTRPSNESRTGSYTYVYIDNLLIERIPTCFVPSQPTVSNVTDHTADVSWTDNFGQTNFAVEYQAEGETTWTSVPATTTSVSLSNLLASTNYTVRVKAVCGTDDESEYTDEVEFTTKCEHGTEVEFTGTSTSSYIPVYGNYNYSYSQQIFKSSEINAATTISGFEIEVSNTGTGARNISIYMMHTSENTISSWLPMDNAQLVYTGVVAFTQGWQQITFDTPFDYNGTDNLVLIMDDNTGTYGSYPTFRTHSGGSSISRYYYSDSYNPDPFNPGATASGTTYSYRNNIRFSNCPEPTDLSITNINTIADACDIDGAVTIGVKNLGYEGTVSAFEAYYQVNEATPVHESVTLATPIAFNEATTYTFTQLPAFAAGENIITAWVELTGDLVDGNNTKVSAPITVLDPIAVPYEEAFTGLTINHGWNPIDANNDGITMNLNNDINYTFNDEAAADDWMMSPCIEMAAGTYTIIYDYKANSSLTEAFEVFYGNGAHVADMTNTVATHSFNNTDYETATTTITIAADGIYNFGFHATSLAGNLGFSIDNFKVYPVNDVIVTCAANGTVTPNGTIAVNYGEDLTLNIVPDPMYHVAGVWVDDVQVVPEDGTGANFMLYTLENVTEPHTVYVDFKLEFHIFKTVENFRPDLYSDLGGAFVPAATDTTIDPNAFTVNMVADPHYHMVGLTVSPMVPDMQLDVFADVVDNGDGTYSYTIDTLVVANYYLNAIFRRDTVAINYNVLTGKGYANDSPLLNTGDTYTTWIDYSVNNDVDTTISFTGHDLYHVADVTVNGTSMGHIDSYTFENVTETQTVDIKFGYKIDASVRNYNTYGDIAMTDPQGTIEPATQYIPEFDPMTVTGTVAEHFHLYQLLVNGENRIDEVVFGADNSYSFSIDSVVENCIIEAVVKVDTFAITYNVLAGQGYADASELLVAGDTYNTIVNYGDNWYSNIVPATGYSIENVLLDGQNLYTASNNQFNFIVESHVFDITFEANTYTITTNAYGAGSVTNGMTFTYDPANPVDYVFNATPEEGYYVSAVIINNEAQDLTGVEGTYTTTIENVADNYVIDVHFSIFTYTMTAEAGEGGTITPAGAQTVNYGTDVTYEINANEGWYIASTDIDGVTTTYTQDDAVVTLTIPYTAINADHNISVTFAQFMYTITATAGTHGTVNGAEAVSANIAYGSNYALTFTPDANYQVADVVVDGVTVGAVDSYEFINVTANHTVEVSFEAIMYTLTATSNMEGCTITPATTTVQAGSNVSYTLSAASGCHLLNVIANGEEVAVTNNAFTITDVQSDYTIFANFAPNYVTVTVNQPAHATITPGTQTYAYGATPSYMIVPEVGYEVVSVTAGNAVVNVTYNNGIGTFTLAALQQDITLTATTSIKKFEITVTQGANGTIAPGTQTNVEYGSNKTFTITPNQYYVIADVIVDGSSRGAISSYTFYNVAGNHTITAVFEANCQTPTNLTAMDIDTSSAVLSWVGTAPSYEVRYKAADAASYTTQTVTTTSLQLTGLTPNTLYEYGVRAICGANLTSDWAINAFTTKALPIGPVDGIANAELSSIKVYSYLNNVYIVNEEGIAISNVDIYDIYGKQVYTGKVLSSPEVISLSVANGNYVVRLATENGVGVYKVAIVR